MSFEKAVSATIDFEGGFDKNPHDRGNWTGGKIGVGILKGTKYGISAAQYPDLDIENLAVQDAKDIYFLDYWNRLFLDEVEDEQIQAEIFDTAVNCGRRFATECAQKSINYLGDDIKVDGDLGSITLSFVNKWCRKDPRALHVCLNGFQFIFYAELVEDDDKDYLRFGRGWTKRIQSY